jgi:FAD/FMN-containing dehydrogenase
MSITVERGDATYEATRLRMVWNDLVPERYPDVIKTLESGGEASEAVNEARSRGLRIAIRSGGHSWIGASLRDGGMLIDLSHLNGVTVDTDGVTAIAEPAIKNTEIVAALTARGLAFPAGHCPTVSLGGYLLAGGQGWNQGGWGPACQNVLAIDYVNAQGELRTTDSERDPDLLWMARGGGPGFPGLILRYHLRTFPAPSQIMQSTYVYPLDTVEEVIPWLAATVQSLPPTVEQMLLLGAPPAVMVGELDGPRSRYLTLWSVAYGSSAEETRAGLAPLDTCPVIDRALSRRAAVPAGFPDLFAVEGAIFPENHRYDVEIIWSDANPSRVIGQIRDRLAVAPSLDTSIIVAVTGPPTVDRAARAMAYSMAEPLYIGIWTTWEHAADDEANRRWHHETVESLRPITRGHYMGETDLLASPNRAAESLGPGVWERVKAVRNRYDPDGVFWGHLGQS